jgi:hypothetical protein
MGNELRPLRRGGFRGSTRRLLGVGALLVVLALPSGASADITFADGVTTSSRFGCDSYFHTMLFQPIAYGSNNVYYRLWVYDAGQWGTFPTDWKQTNVVPHWQNMPSALQGRWLSFWVDYWNTATGEVYGEPLVISQDHGAYGYWCWL